MRILVLRGGALGDFLVTLPALARLRQQWPEARLELAGNATAAALAVRQGLLDAAHSQHEARWSALYADAPLPAAFAEWLARVVGVAGVPGSSFFREPVRHLIRFHFAKRAETLHAAGERLLKLGAGDR